MFCVVLWAAIGARAQALQGRNHSWLYVDEFVTHAPLPELPEIIRAVDSGATHDRGGHLHTAKSTLRVPCLAGTLWTQWPPEFRALARTLPRIGPSC